MTEMEADASGLRRIFHAARDLKAVRRRSQMSSLW
jgi:hypothetical protein